MVEASDASSHRRLTQTQFGANAANYATSAVHAKGASLERMVELVAPAADWHALDIATAAGHTAFAFAPHVAWVVASDLTAAMVELTRDRASDDGTDNIIVARADAEHLGFVDSAFDLVTCRIAPHHFLDPAAFVREAHRVLRPGGRLALVDNIVPDDADAARWYNDWERRRDPSHIRCLGFHEWRQLLDAAGFEVDAAETTPKRMQFAAWVENMSVPEHQRPGLLTDLIDAPPSVREFLRPGGTDVETGSFELTEGLFVANRPG